MANNRSPLFVKNETKYETTGWYISIWPLSSEKEFFTNTSQLEFVVYNSFNSITYLEESNIPPLNMVKPKKTTKRQILFLAQSSL
jgi:hypothetical protein